MKVLCTSDWCGEDPAPVVKIVRDEKPDLVLFGGNLQGEKIGKRAATKTLWGINEIEKICPFVAVKGKNDTSIHLATVYASDLQVYRKDGILVLIIPKAQRIDAIKTVITMFLNVACQDEEVEIKALLVHEPFDKICAEGWDLCVVGGSPKSGLSDNVISPDFFGVWICEQGEDIRFVEFTHAKKAVDA